MTSSTTELRAELRSFPARSSARLSEPGGLLILVVRGSGTLVTSREARIVGPGDSLALGADDLASLTVGSSPLELLYVQLQGVLAPRDAGHSLHLALPRAAQRPLSLHHSRVAKAIALLHAELAHRWTVAELARKVGLSRAAFASHFKAKTGEAPLKYLTRQRLERAAELLISSELSLAEVAERVGYRSEFAFNRAFKRHHGVAPGTFRRRHSGTGPILMRAA